MMAAPPSKLLTYEEAAARLGMSVNALRLRVHKGQRLPLVRIGRTVRFDREDLERYIDARKEGDGYDT